MTPTARDHLYPSFRKEAIDTITGDPPLCLLKFPFCTKGKRLDDIVTIGLDTKAALSQIMYYENTLNRDYDQWTEDESEGNAWRALPLYSLRSPSSCILTDVSGNGFNDLIVTCEYGKTLDSVDPLGGRICWLENYGTDEGDWTSRDIGRFPGINCIKLGHFTTTFSTQILAVVTSDADAIAPFIIYTKPPDIYKSRQWLVNAALENKFRAIQDILVVKGKGTNLDSFVISNHEGLTAAWYCDRKWQHQTIGPRLSESFNPGRLAAFRVRQEPIAYIAAAEADRGGIISLYSRNNDDSCSAEFTALRWSATIFEDFSGPYGTASIEDFLCADFDGDGVDEIVVSVSGANCSICTMSGLYYLTLVSGRFTKYKLSDDTLSRVTSGHFESQSRLDIATLSCSFPRELSLHRHSFITSQIKPFIDTFGLIISIPHLCSRFSEADIIDVAGYALSLVVLPPDTTYHMISDGSEAVKILHGALGWIDAQSALIERTRASGLPGCVTSMLVDSPEGHVRSGNDGAVFVRMRPSGATNNCDLQAYNILPSYFPHCVCDYRFTWTRAFDQPWFSSSEYAGANGGRQELFHLSGFRVRFDDGLDSTEHFEDLTLVHFWAAAPGVSSGLSRHNISPWRPNHALNQSSCSIRACLSNPGGKGKLRYCDDKWDGGMTFPTAAQRSRLTDVILPAMHEHSPFWRSGLEGGDEGIVEVNYPWHEWVAGRVRKKGEKGRMKWHIWTSFDFPAFVPHEAHDDPGICIIS